MKTMFLKCIWFCLFFWSLDGVFGDDEVRSVSVLEGDSVTLNTSLTELINDDLIQWRFGIEITLLAEINKRADLIIVYDDVHGGRFRDRLKLDNQTGSLTITDTRTEDTGRYLLLINHRSIIFSLIVFELKSVSVKEGDSVTLNSDLTEMKDDDVILWTFGIEFTLIAEINKRTDNMTVYDDVLDGRFRNRLKLNNQTGSLTIMNITTQHTGAYVLWINQIRIYLFLIVYREISVMEGDSVTLTSGLTEMKDDDEILWKLWIENILIAELNVTAKGINVYNDHVYERFRGRLKVDVQTGSLTITSTRFQHTGRYELLINHISHIISFLNVFREISVMEGESVTINSGLIEIMHDDQIKWRFWIKETLIAEISKDVDSITVYNVLDGRFRDRLKLDDQTGSLTITNITTEDTGSFELQINIYSSSFFYLTVYAHLPVPVISRDCSSSSSSSTCSLVCSGLNVGHVTLSWYKGNSLLSRISVSDFSISLSLPLEVEYQDKNSYSCVINNPLSHQTTHLDISKLCQPCPDSEHCCGSTGAVIRLVLSVLVGVATVLLLVYDIRSRRTDQDQPQPSSQT